MSRKICELCGRFYEVNEKEHNIVLCQECRAIEKENYTKVREYLYDHNGASAWEIANNTGVSLKSIERFIKEGRIMYKGENE